MKRGRGKPRAQLPMNEIMVHVRFPFVCFLQLLPEPPLSSRCTAKSRPQKYLIWKLCAVQVSPGCRFDAGPSPSAGSGSKWLMGFVTLILLIRARPVTAPALEAPTNSSLWFPGLLTGHRARQARTSLGWGATPKTCALPGSVSGQ